MQTTHWKKIPSTDEPGTSFGALRKKKNNSKIMGTCHKNVEETWRGFQQQNGQSEQQNK